MKTKLWLVCLAVLTSLVIPASAMAGSISGTVTSIPSPYGADQFGVCAFSSNGGSCTTAGPEGEYTIAGLNPGEYWVRFSDNSSQRFLTQYWKGAPTQAAATLLEVGLATETNGIDAEMQLAGSFEGTVTGAEGPLEDALVCAIRVDHQAAFCEPTDEVGEYTLVGLTPGEYKVSIEAPSESGYRSAWYSGAKTEAEAHVFNVSANELLIANARLFQPSTVEGVVSGDGEALAEARVCLYEATGAFVNCGETDETGRYRIGGLSQGYYVAEFSANRYPTRYNGGAESFEGATPVQVGAEETVKIEGALLHASGIRGKVFDAETHAPLEGGYACAQAENIGTYCTPMGADGAYELESLPPATYKVYFEHPGYATRYYNGVATEAEGTPVTVGATMVPGIDGELPPYGAISGHVTESGSGANLTGVKACALTAAGADVGCATTDSSGNYTISNLLGGEYKVRFSRSTYYTQYYEGKELLSEATTVVVPGHATTGSVNAVMVKIPKPTVITPPEVSGTGKVGETLSCSTGAWANNPSSYEYRWYRGSEEIRLSTARTYKLVAADGGKSIKCGVIAVNASGKSTLSQSTGSIAVLAQRTVTVTKVGAEKTVATVTSSPTGISCGSTCTVTRNEGDSLTLSATPAPHTELTGWSGACTGTGPCQITLGTANASVAATFAAITHPVTVKVTGEGSISAASGAISGCTETGGACSGSYDEASEVILTATPGAHRTLAAWNGCTTVNGNQCMVNVAAAAEVTATFKVITQLLVLSPSSGGTVTSAPAGIECPSTCLGEFEEGTTVTMTAHPKPHHEFTGWVGEGCPGTGTCVVTLNESRGFSGEFAQITHQLSVGVVGDGSVSAGSGPISGCTEGGGTCSGTYDEGAEITLAATPAAHHTLIEWSGCTSTTGNECHVPVESAESVTATFAQVTHGLSVTKTGNGSGAVTSAPAGIDCGSTCADTVDEGTTVTLSAAPAPHSEFTGWSGGGCTGTGTCEVTMEAATSVSAGFAQITHGVSVAVTGDGSVGADSGAISGCSEAAGTCAGSYDEGTEVVLTATPDAHQALGSWTGCTTASGDECRVSVGGLESVTASFDPITHQLGVSASGAGAGAVTSFPAGIDCSATCAAIFDEDTTVTLTATPAAGSQFTGWSGACSGTGTCAVTLATDTGVVANFALVPSDDGGGSGDQPAPPSPGPPASAGPSLPTPVKRAPKKPLQCKKGLKQVKVDGKARCAHVKKGKRRRSHRGGAA